MVVTLGKNQWRRTGQCSIDPQTQYVNFGFFPAPLDDFTRYDQSVAPRFGVRWVLGGCIR